MQQTGETANSVNSDCMRTVVGANTTILLVAAATFVAGIPAAVGAAIGDGDNSPALVPLSGGTSIVFFEPSTPLKSSGVQTDTSPVQSQSATSSELGKTQPSKATVAKSSTNKASRRKKRSRSTSTVGPPLRDRAVIVD